MRVRDLTLDYVGSWVHVKPRRFWKRTWEGRLDGVWREGDKWFISIWNAGKENIVEVKAKDWTSSSLNEDEKWGW